MLRPKQTLGQRLSSSIFVFIGYIPQKSVKYWQYLVFCREKGGKIRNRKIPFFLKELCFKLTVICGKQKDQRYYVYSYTEYWIRRNLFLPHGVTHYWQMTPQLIRRSELFVLSWRFFSAEFNGRRLPINDNEFSSNYMAERPVSFIECEAQLCRGHSSLAFSSKLAYYINVCRKPEVYFG